MMNRWKKIVLSALSCMMLAHAGQKKKHADCFICKRNKKRSAMSVWSKKTIRDGLFFIGIRDF